MKARKTYKFPIYPSRAQTTKFVQTLDLCRELYNGAVDERRSAYKMGRVSINFNDQCEQLPAIKEFRPEFNCVYSQVLQDVLHRVDKNFKAFFARCKRGETPGFPRFQGKNRYGSFTYPQLGWSLQNDKLTLSKIGTIRVKLHRAVIGKVKTCTLVREMDSWFVCFSVETEFEPPVHQGPAIGIDVGLEYFANQSDGVQIENPRIYRKAEKQLAKVQRKYSKIKLLPRNNPKKVKAKRALSKAHKRIRNQRLDYLHKLSHKTAKTYRLIVVEDIQTKNLLARAKPKENPEQAGQYLPNGASAKSGLSKSIADASWSTFVKMLSYKVEYTGSKLIKVDPRYTSQICPECGAIAKKELSQRWHSCECGAAMPRDIAAARVILARGLSSVRNQSVEAAPL